MKDNDQERGLYKGSGEIMKAYFDRFTLNITLADAASMSHSGACDSDVENYLATNKSIQRQLAKISPVDIESELYEYGAWNDYELSNDDLNRERIVWIAAGNIMEGR